MPSGELTGYAGEDVIEPPKFFASPVLHLYLCMSHSEKKNVWYQKRRYIHFDSPVSLVKAAALVTDSAAVAKHAFYPFIQFTIRANQLKIDENGELKKSLKERKISYAAHLDSHIYRYYSTLLSYAYEENLEVRGIASSVLAFRSLRKCNINFAKEAFDEIRLRGNCSIIALDISKFFDTLDHKILKESWAKLLRVDRLPQDHFNIFQSLTSFAYVEKKSLYQSLTIPLNNRQKGLFRLCSSYDFRRKVRGGGLVEINDANRGIPQGSSLSGLLANIYMLEFDSTLNGLVAKISGSYRRYCDDMLIIVPTEFEREIIQTVNNLLYDLKLQFNEKKTAISRCTVYDGDRICDPPVQYLGFLYDGKKILIRSAAFARNSKRVNTAVSVAKSTMRKHNRRRTSQGLPVKPLYKKKLYARHSHLGRRNFLAYGYRSAEIMESDSIKQQLRPLWRRLNRKIVE